MNGTSDQTSADGAIELPLGSLYRSHAGWVRWLMLSLGVPSRALEDLVHETFLVASRRLSSAELGKREAQAWLRHTARFVVAAHYRKAVQRREVLDVHAPELSLDDPFELLQAREQTELVHSAIDRLRADESDLVALHVVGELPFRTLATLCRCDAKTARKRFLAAMRAARRTMDQGFRMRGARAMAGPSRPAPAVTPLLREAEVPANEQLIVADGPVTVGLTQRLLVLRWTGPVTLASLEFVRSAAEKARATQRPFGLLALVETGNHVPEFSCRRQIVAFLDELRNDVAALANVAPIGSLAYPVMKALSLLARTPYPVHTLPEVEPALEWILAHVGVPYGERHRRFIDSVRKTPRSPGEPAES